MTSLIPSYFGGMFFTGYELSITPTPAPLPFVQVQVAEKRVPQQEVAVETVST